MSLPSTGTANPQSSSAATTYRGIYSGLVINTLDPLRIDRIEVQIPSLGSQFGAEWAMPQETSGTIVLPAVGAQIDIQFEDGDLRIPIWVPQTQTATGSPSLDAWHRSELRTLLTSTRTSQP
jgi:hypothetical protein